MPHAHLPLIQLILAGGPLAPRRALLDAHATPAQALAAGEPHWRRAGLNAEQIARLHAARAGQEAEIALRWLAEPGHVVLGWQDAAYPPLLRHSRSPPLALFVEGDARALRHLHVAMVGSRAPSPAGRENAAWFATAFSRAGVGVISGLAAGIDAAAHEAALEAGGLTLAVVGTGPDLAYPARHRALRDRIVGSGGAIVSEYLPGTAARPAHFPSRNRIIAGLSVATLVVEAAERSGALITARQAAEAGRDVFALPGSIHNPMARGCHRLIRDGAGLADDPQRLLEELASALFNMSATSAGPLHNAEPGDPRRPPPNLAVMDAHYHRLWQALAHDPTGMDQLAERTGLTAAELSSMLLLMELEGQVAVEHGRYWRK